uniref:F-box domain-containing protein n=1 Tax=Chenopodium quinoa TaxID=63459 RepID=A0A803MQE3_CHEQI
MELITSILTRLPTKSLLRFKCVSKAWNSIISSTHFIGLHLAHSLSSDRRLLILNYGTHLESTPLKWGSELDAKIDLTRNVDDPQLFKFILWNPSMNSHFILPCIPVVGDLSSEFMGVSFGFGEVMVYSLKENCWKMIHVAYFGDEMKWFCSGAVINNCIVHWIFWKYRKREPRLRGFDLSSFKWTKLALPDFRGTEKIDCPEDDDGNDTLSKAEFESNDIVALGVLDECLCIVTRICPEFDNAYVWVMKEYGAEDSWTKLFNVTEASLVGPLLSSPLASSKGGDEVLLRKADEDGLCWYDLRRKSVKAEQKIPRSLKLRDVKLCIESLVPVPGVIDGIMEVMKDLRWDSG